MAAHVTNAAATLVSVIIPCYRAEQFIEEALRSVAAQSHPDWEILIVEDGSHDGTEAIVARFRESVPLHRTSFFQHAENRGVSAARNTALAHARGAFVAFLDADDCWLPEHLALSVQALASSGADLCFSGEQRFNAAGPSSAPAADALNLAGDWRAQLFECNFVVLSSAVVRRDSLERAGVFDPALPHAEDYDLWLRLAAAGAQFTSTRQVTVRYREHPQQASKQKQLMKEREWNVVRRHAATFPAPAVRKRRRLATLAVGAGMEHWSSDPRAAVRYLRLALRWAPCNWRYWWLATKASARTLISSRVCAHLHPQAPAPDWRPFVAKRDLASRIAFARAAGGWPMAARECAVIVRDGVQAVIGRRVEAWGAARRTHRLRSAWLQRVRRGGTFVDDSISFLGDLELATQVEVEPGCTIEAQLTIWLAREDGAAPRLRIGPRSYIGRNTFLGVYQPVEIGAEVLIGAYSYLTSGDHRYERRDLPIQAQGFHGAPVRVLDRAWLGAHVVVLPGVTIGEGAIVGAGSVVTRDVPPYEVWAGAPARKIKERPRRE